MSKARKKVESFVLNDEGIINSHGFRVPNNQINLVRFSDNSVLLYMHKRGEVHGEWINLRVEGSLLLGDPVFDTADPESAKIAGKVERGFLKGASLYLNFTKDTKFVEAADGVIELHGVEAFEGSIVDIPSNARSIKLFADGEELDDDKIKGFMLSATNSQSIKINNKNKMEKVTLSAPAIAAFALAGITPGDTVESINTAVSQLGAKLQAEQTAHNLEKTQREALEKKIKDQEAVALATMVDQAVTDGQIVGAQKEDFIALGFDAAKKIIGGLPKAVSLGAQAAQGNAGSDVDPKNLDEFEKLSTEAKLAFKNNNPAGYAKLFA